MEGKLRVEGERSPMEIFVSISIANRRFDRFVGLANSIAAGTRPQGPAGNFITVPFAGSEARAGATSFSSRPLISNSVPFSRRSRRLSIRHRAPPRRSPLKNASPRDDHRYSCILMSRARTVPRVINTIPHRQRPPFFAKRVTSVNEYFTGGTRVSFRLEPDNRR